MRNGESLQQKILAGERISAAEALEIYRRPLAELGALADARRNLAKGKSYGGRGREIVTYIVDRNINYTNVCNVYCKFCAFYRTEKDADHYVLTREQFDQKLDELTAAGGVQILMQGGHHPNSASIGISSCSITSAKSIRRSISTDSARRSSSISRRRLRCRCVR